MNRKAFLEEWNAKHRHGPKGEALDGGAASFYATRGTYYVRVHCPYCEKKGKGADTKFHCHVHYDDPKTERHPESGNPIHSEGWFKCLRCGTGGSLEYLLGRRSTPPKQKAWSTYVSLPENRVADPRILNRARGLGTKARPGSTIALGDLPKSHQAWRYLVNEGFTVPEIESLCELHGIYYCVAGKSMTSNPKNTTTGRLVWEIREGGELLGWQARWLPKVWPPTDEDVAESQEVEKYLFSPGLRKSHILYNWDAAQRWDMWIVVEGAKKVWKTGEFALATFGIGNNPHPPEEEGVPKEIKEKYWSLRLSRGQRPVGLLYDKGALSTAMSHQKVLENMGVECRVIKTPEHGPEDLDDYSTFEIRQMIKSTMGRLPKVSVQKKD
jgi:hypothetical protein